MTMNLFDLPAVFLFGGLKRADKPAHVPLRHGDVIVWGGRTAFATTASSRWKKGFTRWWVDIAST